MRVGEWRGEGEGHRQLSGPSARVQSQIVSNVYKHVPSAQHCRTFDTTASQNHFWAWAESATSAVLSDGVQPVTMTTANANMAVWSRANWGPH